MRRGTHTRVARNMIAKLTSRQKSLLDSWAKTPAGQSFLKRGAVFYGDLPAPLQKALERAKLTEDLETDTERYLDDKVMQMRYSFDEIV